MVVQKNASKEFKFLEAFLKLNLFISHQIYSLLAAGSSFFIGVEFSITLSAPLR